MGSGSGESRRARAEARRQEEARTARITDASNRVNQIFDAPSRRQQYTDFMGAVRENLTRDAVRQKGVADRNLKFSMARNGLVGGSADRDARRTMGEEFTKGLVQAEDKAQAAGADLRQADETSRMNLLNMVQQGMDATTATQRAGAQMSATAQGARGQALSDGLGDIFGQTADIYKRQQEQAAYRRGLNQPTGLYGKV